MFKLAVVLFSVWGALSSTAFSQEMRASRVEQHFSGRPNEVAIKDGLLGNSATELALSKAADVLSAGLNMRRQRGSARFRYFDQLDSITECSGFPSVSIKRVYAGAVAGKRVILFVTRGEASGYSIFYGFDCLNIARLDMQSAIILSYAVERAFKSLKPDEVAVVFLPKGKFVEPPESVDQNASVEIKTQDGSIDISYGNNDGEITVTNLKSVVFKQIFSVVKNKS